MAFAVDGEVPVEIGALSTVRQISLETISAAELAPETGGAGSVDLGRWYGPESRFGLPPLPTEVTRRIPTLWRLRVDETAGPAALDVRYEIIARNGRSESLSHVDHPEAEIGVRVEPLTPEIIGRDGETAVLEGGMILRLLIGETRYAGSYAGTVTVTLHQL